MPPVLTGGSGSSSSGSSSGTPKVSSGSGSPSSGSGSSSSSGGFTVSAVYVADDIYDLTVTNNTGSDLTVTNVTVPSTPLTITPTLPQVIAGGGNVVLRIDASGNDLRGLTATVTTTEEGTRDVFLPIP